jgi:acetyl esterase/lipase
MDRRQLIGLAAAAAISTPTRADTMAADGSLPGDSKEIVPLWPGSPPGSAGVTVQTKIIETSQTPDLFHDRAVVHVDVPLLTVYRAAEPNGSALLLMPGGGYGGEFFEREGIEPARVFNRAGITCFILRYRLPGDGWADRSDVPLQDAQRAMRLIRANAGQYGVDPAKLGVIGFSAGGHLAASLATRFAANVYAPVDALDAQDAKPVVAGLMYPVTTLGDGTNKATRHWLVGDNANAATLDAYSVDKHIPAGTSPSFICLAADDPDAAPFANGIAMFGALRAARIPAELHVFEQGRHGFTIRNIAGKPASAWPQLFLAWAATHGL